MESGGGQETLVTPQTLLVFSASDKWAEKRLLAKLTEHSQCTRRLDVLRPQDVQLHKNYMVQGRYRLTTTSMRQLCAKMAPSMLPFLGSVAGFRGTEPHRDKHKDCSPVLAANILNRMVRLRFRRLRGHSLIVDETTKTVEGIVGSKYRFLSNLNLYAIVRKFSLRQKKRAVFHEALLYGRKFSIRFCGEEPLFSMNIGDAEEAFLGGFYFANSEVGECAVRASAMVVRRRYGSASLSRYVDGGKIRHIRDVTFEKKVVEALRAASKKLGEPAKLHERMVRLTKLRLGLGDPETHQRVLGRLKDKLNRAGMTAREVGTTMAYVLAFGSYFGGTANENESSILADAMDMYATRTAFDLYNALAYSAKERGPGAREKIEMIAYQVLIGAKSVY